MTTLRLVGGAFLLAVCCAGAADSSATEHAPQAAWDVALKAAGALTAVAVSPVDPDRVYAGTDRGDLYWSADGGSTWIRAYAMADSVEKYAPQVSVLGVLSLKAHPEDGRIAFAGFGWAHDEGVRPGGGPLRTLDGGESWQIPEYIRTREELFSGACALEFAHGTLWVAQQIMEGQGQFGGGVLRSDDLGETFVRWDEGLPYTIDRAGVLSVTEDPLAPGVLYAVVGRPLFFNPQLFRVVDSQHWQRLDVSAFVRCVASAPQTGWLYAGGRGTLLRSRDSGATWDEATQALEAVGEVNAFAFDVSAPLVVYASTNDGVYWSGDGGGAWRRLEGQPPPTAASWARWYYWTHEGPLALSTGTPRRLYLGVDSTLYRATLAAGTPTAVTATTGGDTTAVLRLLKGYPNPSNGGVVLEFDAGGHSPVVLCVYDLLGQVVWRHVGVANRPGLQRVIWPGQRQGGQPAASGAYIVTLECAGKTDRLRVALVR